MSVEQTSSVPSRAPSSLEANGIVLLDHASSIQTDNGTEDLPEIVVEGDESLEPSESERRLHRRLTPGALKTELQRRKYRKWREEDFGGSSKDISEVTTQTIPEGSVPTGQVTSLTREDTFLHRGRERVRGFLGDRRPKRDVQEGAFEIDILYENQRGSFFFGVPLFSHNSLLNFDPAPWVNSKLHKSPVDITNAEVPDPTWEWEWKTWYVDMSHDVDEEGWEYSFSFSSAFSWHGTHPWFHSFVRRRRWLRKRVRKGRREILAHHEGAAKLKQGHMLNAQYFTIHPVGIKTPTSSYAGSPGHRSAGSDIKDEHELWDIVSLIKRLKRAKIDREKLAIVRKFLDQGPDELYYLAEETPHIMSILVFQNSRRQLLTTFMRRCDAASKHREEHLRSGEPENETEKRKIDYLLSAVKVADKEVQKLEYWSDQRRMVRKGETFEATDEAHGWNHTWEGIDASGPGMNSKTRDNDDLSEDEDGFDADRAAVVEREAEDPSKEAATVGKDGVKDNAMEDPETVKARREKEKVENDLRAMRTSLGKKEVEKDAAREAITKATTRDDGASVNKTEEGSEIERVRRERDRVGEVLRAIRESSGTQYHTAENSEARSRHGEASEKIRVDGGRRDPLSDVGNRPDKGKAKESKQAG